MDAQITLRAANNLFHRILEYDWGRFGREDRLGASGIFPFGRRCDGHELDVS